MFGLIGIVVIFVMVFGGYLLAGGKLAIILKSLPFEMMMIGGAALGAFLISNDMGAVKQTAKDIGKVFKGPKWKPEDYRDLLCLLFSLIRIARQNPVSLEAHIEDPDNSDLFAKYPKIRDDHEAVDLIADTLRSASMNYDDPHQVEEVLEKRIENALHLHGAPGIDACGWQPIERDGYGAAAGIHLCLHQTLFLGALELPEAQGNQHRKKECHQGNQRPAGGKTRYSKRVVRHGYLEELQGLY